MGKLTDVQIRHWVKTGVPVAKADGDGLTFTLSKGGTATWILRYRMGGKQREKTIGRFPDISLKRARELATEDRARIQQGINVAIEKQRDKHEALDSWTVREIAADYEAKRLPTLATNSKITYKQIIRDFILPAIGHLPVRDVKGSDVVAMMRRAESLVSVYRVKPVLSVATSIFAHAIGQKSIDVNPCFGIVASAVSQIPVKEPARLKLTENELRLILTTLPVKVGRVIELIFRVLLITGVRINALITAEKEHVNLETREWLIPRGDGRKSSRDFVVPITDSLHGYFVELFGYSGNSRYLLPIQKRPAGGREGDVPMAAATVNQAFKRVSVALGSKCRPFSPHDLRSTMRSYLSELKVNLIVAERCLNHSLGGLVAVYDQHDYLDERRHALELWETKIAAIEADADNVVVLQGRAA